jgi:hypothetical protein
VSGGCFVMGEAAGTATALALSRRMPLHELTAQSLRQALAAQGAFLG